MSTALEEEIKEIKQAIARAELKLENEQDPAMRLEIQRSINTDKNTLGTLQQRLLQLERQREIVAPQPGNK